MKGVDFLNWLIDKYFQGLWKENGPLWDVRFSKRWCEFCVRLACDVFRYEDFGKTRFLHLRRRKVIWVWKVLVYERNEGTIPVLLPHISATLLRLLSCLEDKWSYFLRNVPSCTASELFSCLLPCGVNMKAYGTQYFNMYFAFLFTMFIILLFPSLFFFPTHSESGLGLLIRSHTFFPSLNFTLTAATFNAF